MSTLDEEFIFQILAIVDEIPYGKVATYGQIARLASRDNNSRLVGKALSLSCYYGSFPCHRVVNASGKLAPYFYNQMELLIQEGVSFKENGCVDFKKYRWEK